MIYFQNYFTLKWRFQRPFLQQLDTNCHLQDIIPMQMKWDKMKNENLAE